MTSRKVQAAEYAGGKLVSVLEKDSVFRDKPVTPARLWTRGPLRAFLPEGYPASVTDDYASMCVYVDWINFYTNSQS